MTEKATPFFGPAMMIAHCNYLLLLFLLLLFTSLVLMQVPVWGIKESHLPVWLLLSEADDNPTMMHERWELDDDDGKINF